MSTHLQATGQVTLVGGKFRGKKLEVPPGNALRPTAHRVREAIFDVLQHWVRWPEVWALDLYAGSGALGLEALSRGAAHVILAEKEALHLRTLRHNVASFGQDQKRIEVISAEAQSWLSHWVGIPKLTVLFLDPPYHASEYEHILEVWSQHSGLIAGSLAVIEAPRDLELILANYGTLIQSKVYGQTRVDFLLKS